MLGKKISYPTINDVLPHHPDVFVSIAAGLLMVKAQSMEQFVLDSTMVQTALATQRDNLQTTASANIGVAPGVPGKENKTPHWSLMAPSQHILCMFLQIP